MQIGVLGGAGAMGGVIGAKLAHAGQEVTLIDVWTDAVNAINASGMIVEDKAGDKQFVKVRAVTDPAQVAPVDLLLVFVKCYHTEDAVTNAAPVIGKDTVVMTLQNGWGNAPRISNIVGAQRVLVGLTYHSGTTLGPGHVKHTGQGMTYMGELNGMLSNRLNSIADVFRSAGLDVTVTQQPLKEIWSKLALNICTLPTGALLRFSADQLVQHAGTLSLMQNLLKEAVAVANAQNIPLDYDERWEAITSLLKKAIGARASMLQDVEKGRQTEIDVINGAIVAAGKKLAIPTPYNQSMVWLVKALEETFPGR